MMTVTQTAASHPPPPRKVKKWIDWSDTYTLRSVGEGWEIWNARSGNGRFFAGDRWLLQHSSGQRVGFAAKKDIAVWFQQVADATGKPNAEPKWTRATR